MPIERVPVVHKFGIISHTQRLELQERLFKRSYIQALESKKPLASARNPLEVTEEFVQQFNSTQTFEEQEKKEAVARKMLERIKRRSGLKTGGYGNHVDLPVAWTELAQLAQCKGPIQEECLDVLISSLDQAQLEKGHTPALFYLAETTLYWLRTEAIHQPYLRTGELKLLRMGQLVFTRLFYHHMAGELQGQNEFKNRLFTYLDGFGESQEAYAPYPNALLSLRYINEVGKMIIGDFNLEAGEVKEGDNVPNQDSQPGTSQIQANDKTSSDDYDLFHEVSAHFEGTQSSESGAISSSVHDLSPTLWHALDVWRCVHHASSGLQAALRSLGSCGMGLASESWVDGIGALLILADAGKANLQALKVVQNLARGIRPAPKASPSTHNMQHSDDGSKSSRIFGISQECSGPTDHSKQLALSDICEKTEETVTSETDAQNMSPKTLDSKGIENFPDNERRSKTPEGTDSPEKFDSQNAGSRTGADSMFDPAPNTAWGAEIGTDLPSGRASEASSVPTYSNKVFPDMPGLHGWHWEVAITYVDVLTDICLHGSTSNIQKVALVGNNQKVHDLHKSAVFPRCPLQSAGLLDLAFFHAAKESHDEGPNDWSWRVRYSAIQGLVKLCRCSVDDANRDGLRTVAWNNLIKAHSMEKDIRVLEALKVGQVDANIENLLQQNLAVTTSTIGAKMAAGLSSLYLPALPPPVEVSTSRRPWDRQGKPQPVLSHPVHRKPLRTTLGQEILLSTALYEPPPGFNTRTDFDLRRVVEDQWRKDLQQQLKEEDEEHQKELHKRQKEEETERHRIEEQRAAKLGNKYRGKAYQYQTDSGTSLLTTKKQSV